MIAIALRERLSGAMVRRGEAAEEHIALDLDWTLQPFARTSALALAGVVRAKPIVASAPVTGMGFFEGARALVYALSFRGDDGRALALRLERRLTLENPYTSLTVLLGTLTDEAKAPVARCILRFDARSEAGGVLSSLRLLTARTARRTFHEEAP